MKKKNYETIPERQMGIGELSRDFSIIVSIKLAFTCIDKLG